MEEAKETFDKAAYAYDKASATFEARKEVVLEKESALREVRAETQRLACEIERRREWRGA